MSLRKADTLRHVARVLESGEMTAEILSRSTSPDALRLLSALPGIGPWSAALILLRGMRRLDVFPPGDVGRCAWAPCAIAPVIGLGAGSHHGPLRRTTGYLYFYSLGGSLLAKGLIHPAPAYASSERFSAK